MKKLLAILFLFFVIRAVSQPTVTFPILGSPHSITFPQGWLRVDSGFLNAVKDTLLAPVRIGEQRFRTQDSTLYIANSIIAGIRRWLPVGSGSGNNAVTLNIQSDYQKSATLTDGNIYKAWPSSIWTPHRDTVLMVYKTADTHGNDGWLMGAYSINGGASWIVDTITINGVNEQGGTVDIGYNNGTVVIDYTESANGTVYDTTRFAYCTLANYPYFTKGSRVAKTTSQGNVSPYGRMTVMPSGTFLFPAYAWNTGTDTAQVFLYKSTDFGVTWTIGPTIAKKKRSDAFPGGDFNETNIQIVTTGTNDATTTLMALSRSESHPGFHYLFYTTGGFTTWVDASITQGDWAFGDMNTNAAWAFPVSMYNDGQNIYAAIAYRGNSQRFYFRLAKKPLSAYTTASKASWTKVNGANFTTLFQALNSEKGGSVDFGYPTIFPTPTNELKVALYDVAISARPGVDGVNLPTIENVFPLLGNNYFDASSTTNQSITSGTETVVNTVSTGTLWYDSENSWSVDSSKIYIMQDGWYQFYAKVQFDTSSLGTYRQATLYAVDWGTSYGTTPQYAKYVIAKKTIQPSTTTDFNFVELNGQMWCYKGMEVRLTVQHDKGSALNLLNPSGLYPQLSTNATIRFKKIN